MAGRRFRRDAVIVIEMAMDKVVRLRLEVGRQRAAVQRVQDGIVMFRKTEPQDRFDPTVPCSLDNFVDRRPGIGRAGEVRLDAEPAQGDAEIERRLRGTRPFGVAEKMKYSHVGRIIRGAAEAVNAASSAYLQKLALFGARRQRRRFGWDNIGNSESTEKPSQSADVVGALQIGVS